MDRRTFLATTGITLSTFLGGCLGESGNPSGPNHEPESPTDDPPSPTTPDATESPTSPVTIEGIVVDDVIVRKAITYESTMGSGGVLTAHGHQYVVASVRASRELSASEFTFETDEDSWSPGLPDTAGAINYAAAGHEGGPIGRSMGGDQSYLAFAVPSPLSASNPRIQYAGSDTSKWPLSAEMRERLAAPSPRFELATLDVPDEVSQGKSLSVSLSVRNVSETAGRFLAALYWPTKLIADDDESHIVEREVPAGNTVTASFEIDTEYTTDVAESVTLSVQGHVTAEREVQVRDASTPS